MDDIEYYKQIKEFLETKVPDTRVGAQNRREHLRALMRETLRRLEKANENQEGNAGRTD